MSNQRMENELASKYLTRLVNGKLEKKIEIDWSEISELTNIGYSSESMRKSAYGIKILADMIDGEKIDGLNPDLIKEIEIQKRELHKERIKLQDQRKEYNALIRADARFEYLIETMVKAAEDMNEKQPLKFIRCDECEVTENEGVLLISDWHYGLEIDNAFNKYNPEIFEQRLLKLVGQTVRYGKAHNIRKLNVFNLSDLISGIIHTTVRIANVEDVVSQVQHVSEYLAETLGFLSSQFDEIDYYSTLDNHSRLTANKKENLEKESFTRIITWYLKTRLKDFENITIKENKYGDDFIVTEICGHKIIAVHGHNDKSNKIASDLPLILKELAEYIFLGHGHHSEEDEQYEIEPIMNPSFSGVDEYALSIRRTSKPAQKFMIFNESEGRVCTYNIGLKLN